MELLRRVDRATGSASWWLGWSRPEVQERVESKARFRAFVALGTEPEQGDGQDEFNASGVSGSAAPIRICSA